MHKYITNKKNKKKLPKNVIHYSLYRQINVNNIQRTPIFNQMCHFNDTATTTSLNMDKTIKITSTHI